MLLPYEHKPLWFFVKGEMPSDEVPSVAIVGARNCTGYGKSMAKEIAYDLTKAGVQVISGMARGIDSYSHIGALNAGGKTFAVLGCGPDICYPKENINMYSDIVKNGGVISEYVPGTMPLAMQFPQRNRIISGLSDRVIVIEAREKSGSLITVEWALEQGKDVMALPGRTTDSLSTGCNRLIKSGAALITSAKDVLEEMGLKTEEKQQEKKINIALEKDLQVVYSCVDLSLKHLHIIIEETGFEYEKTVKILLELQMLNLIDEPVKDYFMRKT